MVEVEVPLATMLTGFAEMVEVVGLAATGTDPQISSEGVPEQLNVFSNVPVEVPSPILPFVL